ncbi:MAG: phosphate ABC transporter permease subunit PstC [Oligoflexia bacterium]|nr:phosphate ABC transporter permease subunit PstC [Oligoflexia bacterium]
MRNFQFYKEKFIEFLLFGCAFLSVIATIGIALTLIVEAIAFFKIVSLKEFFTSSEWTPMFSEAKYGIAPLIAGTFLTTIIALLVAIPFGTIIAVFLSEYANKKFREAIKPVLEVLTAIPTVVFGYFALLFITPKLQVLLPDLPGFNVLSAGLVMGVMIIPYVSSLSEDAMQSVPNSLREGAYALGATKLRTAFTVIFPAALSGITSSYILAISRAVGETMIVAIAAGMQPNLTLNPTEPAQTITAYIVQVSMGDLPHGTIGYQTIFVAGLVLFIFTFLFNILGVYLRRRFREVY